MKDELMNELCRILNGSKEFTFEYGDYGMSVLKLINYNTGAVVRLDLGKLMEEYSEVVEDIIVNEIYYKYQWNIQQYFVSYLEHILVLLEVQLNYLI